MICDNCYFAGLFHCTHPQNYIQPFKEVSCDLYKEGPERVRINERFRCTSCNKIFNINTMFSKDKGARLLCGECNKK